MQIKKIWSAQEQANTKWGGVRGETRGAWRNEGFRKAFLLSFAENLKGFFFPFTQRGTSPHQASPHNITDADSSYSHRTYHIHCRRIRSSPEGPLTLLDTTKGVTGAATVSSSFLPVERAKRSSPIDESHRRWYLSQSEPPPAYSGNFGVVASIGWTRWWMDDNWEWERWRKLCWLILYNGYVREWAGLLNVIEI